MGDRIASVVTFKDVFAYRNLVHAVAGAVMLRMSTPYPSPIDHRTKYPSIPPISSSCIMLSFEDGRTSKLSIYVVKDIWDEEGIVGIYRGWWPVVTSICCSNFVYFYVFTGLKAFAYKGGVKPYPAKDLLLAFFAGIVNVVTTTPLWVANTRLRLQGIKWKHVESKASNAPDVSKTHYNGLFDAVSQIFQKDGAAGLWSGALPSAVLATNPAVQFMIYEALKRKFQKMFNQKELSAFTYFLMGAIAKMVATFVTYPIQLIQSRLRAGHGKEGIWQCIESLIRSHGWKSLYKGLEAKLTTTVAMAALMFLTYEKIAAVVFRIMRHQVSAVKIKAA